MPVSFYMVSILTNNLHTLYMDYLVSDRDLILQYLQCTNQQEGGIRELSENLRHLTTSMTSVLIEYLRRHPNAPPPSPLRTTTDKVSLPVARLVIYPQTLHHLGLVELHLRHAPPPVMRTLPGAVGHPSEERGRSAMSLLTLRVGVPLQPIHSPGVDGLLVRGCVQQVSGKRGQ